MSEVSVELSRRHAVGRSADSARPARNDFLASWRTPRTSVLVLGAGIFMFVLSRVIPFIPLLHDRRYGDGIGAFISRPISLVTGIVPFSVAELLVACYSAWLLVLVARASRWLLRQEPGAGVVLHVLRNGAFRAARHAGVALIALYTMWGMNYARPPFAQQAGWPAWDGVESGEILTLLEQATRIANESYIELHNGAADAGRPTQMPADRARFDAAIDEGWRRAAARLDLPPLASARFGPAKWSLTSVSTRFGIAGVYSFFTGEANVARGLPAMRAPHTIAHEKAHQRGVAREADANFLGFLAGAHAPDPLARYAAAMFASQQLSGLAWSHADGDDIARILGQRLRGVIRDRRDLTTFWLGRESFVTDIGSTINNTFLLANGIDAGAEDYRRSVFLLIAWARLNGGQLMPQAGEMHAVGRR